MTSKRREQLKSEIVRRRVREMFPQGFAVKFIADVAQTTDKHVRQIIEQEFPHGRELDATQGH